MTYGSQGSGGGALGAILATPLVNLLGKVGAAILCVGVVIMLAVFTFGINMSEIINNLVEKSEENREERLERKQKIKEEQLKARQEAIENRKKQRQLANQNNDEIEDENIGEQIKINFGGRLLNEEDTKTRKKYDHKDDDLTPLTKESKKKQTIQPDVIENNLFRQEEEKKEVIWHDLGSKEPMMEKPEGKMIVVAAPVFGGRIPFISL